MTNNNLRADLISEIQNMENFFRDLPRDVRDRYGLDDRPLTVRFGPDVETVFVDEDGVNVFRSNQDSGANNLLQRLLHGAAGKLRKTGERHERNVTQGVWGALNDQKIGVKNDVNTDDDKFVEIRFEPDSALSICEQHDHAQEVMDDFAHDRGWHAHSISSHLHMSVVQGDYDRLFVGPPSYVQLNSLGANIAHNMVDNQRCFPAFFIRPFRAEQNVITQKPYSGPWSIAFHETDSRVTVRTGNRTLPVSTIESRVSPDDPYQMLYLTLKSLEDALTENNPIMGNNNDGAPRVRRGAGGYLEMLEETARNLDEYPDAFPQHISDAMMRASIKGYEQYFEEHAKAKPNEIDDLVGRMQMLKQKFPEFNGMEHDNAYEVV